MGQNPSVQNKKSDQKFHHKLTLHRLSGWILDVEPCKVGLKFWIIPDSSQKSQPRISLIKEYHPKFTVAFSSTFLNKNTVPRHQIFKYYQKKLEDDSDIHSVSIENVRIHAEDSMNNSVLTIAVKSPLAYKKVIKKLKTLDIFDFYNSDIPLVQIFFYESGVFPFAYCDFYYHHSSQKDLIQAISLQDSNLSVEYVLPPLRVIWLTVDINTTRTRPDVTDIISAFHIAVDPCGISLDIHQIRHPFITYHDTPHPHIRIKAQNEMKNLILLQKIIKILDPDIIFTTKGDELLFPYLLYRLERHHLQDYFSLSRTKTPLHSNRFNIGGNSSYQSYGRIYHKSSNQFYLKGRLHIDSAIMGGLHFDDGNLFGIVEVARISYITLQRLTRITIGGALQSMQFYHAYHHKILIPEEKTNSEYFQDSYNLFLSDRGGHILNPKVGLFTHVAELDFTSMYPSLMVRYNVSPEVINCSCCNPDISRVPGLPYHICEKREGIVSLSLRIPLQKRILYKQKTKHLDYPEKLKYEKMQEALKWILVVCFGYLGFRNARFGRIEAHQTVCAYSRRFLLDAWQIVEKHGLNVIHGIVDSLYVQAPPTMSIETFHEKCDNICQEIIQKTQIPITYDPKTDFFDIMCFLPTKANPEIGALNRYWGIKPEGKMKIRGVEIRRHDSPPLIKEFQTSLIQEIYAKSRKIHQISLKSQKTPSESSFDLYKNQELKELYHKVMIPHLQKYYSLLESSNISPKSLAITIRLTRHVENYKVNNYQKSAAELLQRRGIYVGPGEKVSFIIVNDAAPNHLDRVIPLEFYSGSGQSFDLKKYRELLARALVNLFPSAIPSSELIRLINLPASTDKLAKFQQKTLLKFLG